MVVLKKVKVHVVIIYSFPKVSVYVTVFSSDAQTTCAPAAVLHLAHGGQSIMCGSSLDRAVLSASLFRKEQQSPIMCL